MESKVVNFVREPNVRACPNCENGSARRSLEKQAFEYGTGSDAVSLVVDVPVWSCPDCGFQFTDDVGERLRHNAICNHKGLLNPDEIRAIRKNAGLSAQAFGELSGIGVASIKRWESGQLLQNKSSDNLLRLLALPENIERLRQQQMPINALPPRERFHTQFSEMDSLRATAFQLRRNTPYLAQGTA